MNHLLNLSFFDNNALFTSGFVDDIMFSHNGGNGAESNDVMVASGSSRGLMSRIALLVRVLPHEFSIDIALCAVPLR